MKKFVIFALLALSAWAVISQDRMDKVPVKLSSFRVTSQIGMALFIRVISTQQILQEDCTMFSYSPSKDLIIKILSLFGLMADQDVLHF